MRLARRWENWKELADMRRFGLKMAGELPGLYDWASTHIPSGLAARRKPELNFGDLIQRMRELVRDHLGVMNFRLEARLTATDAQKRKLDYISRIEAGRLAMALRNLKAKAKKLGAWSEAHEEEFGKWMRLKS